MEPGQLKSSRDPPTRHKLLLTSFQVKL